ncbi:hypothetical protein CYLTODRAFT_427812 [Cylindrobasidium torrendii FP15055 ss-10]|uniref:Uncharacterized protein n=1 Tax=Cylindrobasidium torrendii FP15055 ss-10 TaxID=1314674 RepID=A0A0D7ARG6_9AGAR|nr:hypothetical protein CYLTODRAFT_427812 [Cylindrobasidium torrendii FP15055 ss-10]
MPNTTGPNVRTNDNNLRAQFKLVLAEYPRTHAIWMETFPGWIKTVAAHNPSSETKTEYRERKHNIELANAKHIEQQEAWLVANAEAFNNALEDAAKCWSDKGKKKDTGAPKPKPLPMPSDSSDEAPPMAPPFKPKANHRLHLISNPPSPRHSPPRQKKRQQSATVTDKQRASKRLLYELLSSAVEAAGPRLSGELLKAATRPKPAKVSTPKKPVALPPKVTPTPTKAQEKVPEKVLTPEGVLAVRDSGSG